MSSPEQHALYRAGRCIDCGGKPSPGRPRCDDCHHHHIENQGVA